MKAASIVWVFLGAGVGGTLRYVLGGWMTQRWGPAFPWHTLAINIAGAFLLGVLMALSVERSIISSQVRLLLGVGLLGGFTTFSTLSYESVALLQQGLVFQGTANMLGTAVLGIGATVAGLLVGRAI